MKSLSEYINENNAVGFKIEKIIDKQCGRYGEKEIYLKNPITIDGQEYTKVGKYDDRIGTRYVIMIDDSDRDGLSLVNLSDKDEENLWHVLDKKEFTVK